MNAGALISEIRKNGTNLLSSVNIFDLYESDELKDNSKSIAFSLSFESNERTLNDSEVDEIVDRIVSRLVKKFKAVQR